MLQGLLIVSRWMDLLGWLVHGAIRLYRNVQPRYGLRNLFHCPKKSLGSVVRCSLPLHGQGDRIEDSVAEWAVDIEYKRVCYFEIMASR